MSKGKIAITVVFAVLVFLVLAAAGFFGITAALMFRDLLADRDALRSHNQTLETDVGEWDENLADTTMLKMSIDSLRADLASSQSGFAERFTEKDALAKTPRFEVTDTVSSNLWIEYPFKLTLTGNADALEEYLKNLGSDFPLLRLESIDGVVRTSNTVLEIIGFLRFPNKP